MRTRHRDALGERALVALGQQRALRVERLVGAPVGVADHRVDDDLVAVLVEPGGVAAEDHRQPVLGEPDAAQRPQVVVVQRRGLDGHDGPPVGHLGLGALPDPQPAQRVVGVDLLGEHGQHCGVDRTG